MSQDQWCSPGDVAMPLRRFFTRKNNPTGAVGLDPCSNPRSIILAKRTFCAGALQLPWNKPNGDPEDDGYENPPYSNLLRWSVKRSAELAARRILEHVTLVPVATSTEWFGVTVQSDPLMVFTKRIEFLNEKGIKEQGARFDSILFLWAGDRSGKRARSKREDLFLECFAPLVRSVVRGRDWTVKKGKST